MELHNNITKNELKEKDNKMKEEINEEMKKTIIELFSKISKIHGLSKSVGEVYGCIYASHNPLCIDDIMEELGISRGNVSMNLNKLEKLGFIKKVWVKGERKQYYEPLCGFSSILDIVGHKHALFLDASTKLRELNEKSNGENELILDKLQNLEKMEKLLKKILVTIKEINKNSNSGCSKTFCEHNNDNEKPD
ncbi:regulatory protein ArsR [Methanococcus aeolicus Nankai-3]|uniref:HTH-type transcriptional regulator n=1 Tax=Methanococcus aeolicus (strain ATCC BAA-1280 / DSM 17508 / OCM 812 / Nankai-3) TaxID=419665 RepID=A6UWK2_META3|nr:regulatory protein ArsR [Methanococcus aeolicus Nankai-3]